MTDVQFVDSGNRSDRCHIFVVQGMPRIEAHSGGADRLTDARDSLQLGAGSRTCCSLSPMHVRIGTGVDLTDGDSDSRGGLNLTKICVDERTRGNSSLPKFVDDALQRSSKRCNVEPPFRRDFQSPLRNQHRRVRSDSTSDRHHFGSGCHLEVERNANRNAQLFKVGILNVPPIFAQVHSDAIRTCEFHFTRGKDRVGLKRPPRLTKCGDMVDVDAQLWHAVMLEA